MKNYSALVADIVGSTSLNAKDKVLLENSIQTLFVDISKVVPNYGRLIKGDTLEMVVEDPSQGLSIALAIKAFIKTLPIDVTNYDKNKIRAKHFKTHGVRLAIGYGPLSRYDKGKGIIDGEAIYHAGRAISNMHTYNKERIVIKNTLFFESADKELNVTLRPIFELLDVLLSKATEKQAMVLYLKLLGNTETEISKLLGIDQSVVNRHSTAVGWNAIETSVGYYSTLFNKDKE
ncbi:fumarate hydratase [Patiriisocius sp. Uisw_017]|jgi:hypothetical protein|uniref:fumarate hydratase n=1 Tax=Patiriisocius sp. Uisw_017 TaxID=3230968 RepID=UPI0039E93AD0